jgi:ABC-type Fe3+/spermidine/putrescine transport system ATPase subunit
VRVPRSALTDRTGTVAVGIRPEKIELGTANENQLEGPIVESAYVGVATQYIVETACGRLTVYVQNANPGSAAGLHGRVSLSWSPDATFVVDTMEENE